jgi:hypothetical protein
MISTYGEYSHSLSLKKCSYMSNREPSMTIYCSPSCLKILYSLKVTVLPRFKAYFYIEQANLQNIVKTFMDHSFLKMKYPLSCHYIAIYSLIYDLIYLLLSLLTAYHLY